MPILFSLTLPHHPSHYGVPGRELPRLRIGTGTLRRSAVRSGCVARFDSHVALPGEHLMPGDGPFTPKAKIERRLADPELTNREVRQPQWKHGVEVDGVGEIGHSYP